MVSRGTALGVTAMLAVAAVGCADDDTTAESPTAAPDTSDDAPADDDASEAPANEDDGGGLTRDGGAEGGSLEHGGSVDAPSLERRALELFGDLEAGQAPEGAVVELPDDVLFDFDDDELKPEADEVLDELAELAGLTEQVPIEVVGHTDGVGSESYNLDLSRRRAEAVVAGLVDRDVDEQRLSADGVGFAEPVAEEGGSDDEEARARNRRVEVTFEGVDLED